MTAQHTVADMARYMRHPEVALLWAEAHRINAIPQSGRARGIAMKAPLDAIRVKVAEPKARGE